MSEKTDTARAGGHTPGPWFAHPTGPVMNGYSQPWGISSADGHTVVAGCFGDTYGGAQMAADNARLIAAALELLSALIAYDEYLEVPQDRGGKIGPKGVAWQRFLDLKSAAIAKATGARQ